MRWYCVESFYKFVHEKVVQWLRGDPWATRLSTTNQFFSGSPIVHMYDGDMKASTIEHVAAGSMLRRRLRKCRLGTVSGADLRSNTAIHRWPLRWSSVALNIAVSVLFPFWKPSCSSWNEWDVLISITMAFSTFLRTWIRSDMARWFEGWSIVSFLWIGTRRAFYQ